MNDADRRRIDAIILKQSHGVDDPPASRVAPPADVTPAREGETYERVPLQADTVMGFRRQGTAVEAPVRVTPSARDPRVDEVIEKSLAALEEAYAVINYDLPPCPKAGCDHCERTTTSIPMLEGVIALLRTEKGET